MASKAVVTGLLLVLVVTFAIAAMSQPNCGGVLANFGNACSDFINGSRPTPSASCCSALANVARTDGCICQIVSNPPPRIVPIAAFFRTCNVPVPPVACAAN